jgi:hypothetical protein
MKRIFLVAAIIIYGLGSHAQECGNCKQTPSVALYDLDVQVPQPEIKGEKTQGWLEWLQLFWLGRHANAALFQNNKNCIRFTQPSDARISDESFVTKDGVEVPSLNEESQQIKVGATYTNIPPSGDVSRFGNYITTGYVKKSGANYVMHMEIQTACSRKTVAVADVPFQLSVQSSNTISIANQAISQLSPLVEKIKKFELQERKDNKNVALEGGTEDAIQIKPKKRNLAAGEQTEIDITMKDCDGEPLANREIVFTKAALNGMPISSGTTGGTVTPSTVTTDAGGKAKAMFKMGSEKTAIIDAHHIYQKPYGCEDVKLGSTPIGGIPIQVHISYEQDETRTLKRATLPGIKIKGGEETEKTKMTHTSVLYHYPSASALKKGFLVLAENEDPDPGSKTEHVLETGRYDFSKNVENAQIIGMIGNMEAVQGEEKGSIVKYKGYASIKNPSQFSFYKGDGNNPPQISWDVQYPTSNDGMAGGGMVVVKGEKGVTWQVNKITDPNIPYKTEYLLQLTLNAAEELKEGDKAMKDLFGFDLGGLTTAIDPTKPSQNPAGASGFQTITVRILSPYPAE